MSDAMKRIYSEMAKSACLRKHAESVDENIRKAAEDMLKASDAKAEEFETSRDDPALNARAATKILRDRGMLRKIRDGY